MCRESGTTPVSIVDQVLSAHAGMFCVSFYWERATVDNEQIANRNYQYYSVLQIVGEIFVTHTTKDAPIDHFQQRKVRHCCILNFSK